MQKFARFVVKQRIAILILAVLLLIPSAVGAAATHINYDILTYLPPELDSMVGADLLEDDFQIASTAMVTVEGMTPHRVQVLAQDLDEIPGVRQVVSGPQLTGGAIPSDMLPADLASFFYGKNDSVLLLIRFDESSTSQTTMNAMQGILDRLDQEQHSFLGGLSAIVQGTKSLVDSELPLYILCAVACCLVVLYLSLAETVVPFLFMLGIAFPIAYNFGTNIFLGQISYITQALSTVLQLGVTMDFSIFLLHRFEEERDRAGIQPGQLPDPAAAAACMEKAICSTASSIAGSSLTTIAGFLAMCTMSLTLGADIGIVMAKGVALGVVCTVTILPALILTFQKPIAKHTHRTFIPRLRRAPAFVTSHPAAVVLVFLVLFIPFALAQNKVPVYYTLADSLPKSMPAIAGTERLKDDFDMTSTHFILVDDQLPGWQMKKLTDELGHVEGIHQVMSYEKAFGEAIPEELIPDDIRELFHAGNHRMLLANSSFGPGTAEQDRQLQEMNTILKNYDPAGVITGEAAMTSDLIRIADVDFRNVSITSILAVFAIVAIVFKSLSIPVLLVAGIQAAITINMGIPYFTGAVLPFVASIVVGTIQLGATVDYAILVTTRFKEELSGGNTVRTAARIAAEQCSSSILTSGLTFFVATASVAAISKIDLIGGLCMLISRGALISMFVILFILPALLILAAPVIQHTTLRWPCVAKESKKNAGAKLSKEMC